MSDEQIVEVIAAGFYNEDTAYLDTWESQPEEGVKAWYRTMARAALAALWTAGFAVVRPEEVGRLVDHAQRTVGFSWPIPTEDPR
ncbi:MAG TPA: hypothetical protein VIG24_02330 [Acidimicrobiia bacterium]